MEHWASFLCTRNRLVSPLKSVSHRWAPPLVSIYHLNYEFIIVENSVAENFWQFNYSYTFWISTIFNSPRGRSHVCDVFLKFNLIFIFSSVIFWPTKRCDRNSIDGALRLRNRETPRPTNRAKAHARCNFIHSDFLNLKSTGLR